MDEITLLASSLPDAPPPAPEVVARARARLTTHEARRRPRFTWTLIIGAAMATAAVITAVALAATLLAPSPPPVLKTPKTGKELLLDLADRVEKLPPETGAYWRTRMVQGSRYLVGMGAARYWIVRTGDKRTWIPRKSSASTVYESESLGLRPETPRDEKIWREQGAPDKWRMSGKCESPDPRYRCGPAVLTSKTSPRFYRIAPSVKGEVGDQTVAAFTIADLDALPADPARLRERLEGYHKVWEKRGFKEPWEEFLGWSVPNMLYMPIRPAVRATLLRLYAELPGAVSAREVISPSGRPVIAVDLQSKKDEEYLRLRNRMVPVTGETLFDPRTGVNMGSRVIMVRAEDGLPKGTVLAYTAVSERGWTDERPVLPPGCHPKGTATTC
ncbi:hypothetical protein [Streptosporangium sp. NPDC000396]|uniref:hypothetical protein n=1 Tax=Streptosporangium sp. NPDC000396 TaxID=3366185 RepID=UPI0036CCECA3